MKRLIFDIDNTLIKWKSEYTSALEKTIEEFKLEVDYQLIDAVIEIQEKKHEMMNKQQLLKDINEETNLNLSINFIDRLLENQKVLAEPNEEVINTLEYLSKKFEMVILTNYFTDTQIGRLKTAKIDKYFSKVIGGDMVPLKPNKMAFEEASEGIESIMIGDSVVCDIEGALSAGFEVIQIDYYNKYDNNKNYPIIKEFKELKEIL